MECAGKHAEIPNFDKKVKTRSGQRIWINMSSVVFDNQRTGERLLIHLAHEIMEQKKSEELVHKMLDLSPRLGEVGEAAVRAAPARTSSDQEKHILRLFAEGKNRRRSPRLWESALQTLRNHLHHINQKLRTHNRLEAVMHALQRRLI